MSSTSETELAVLKVLWDRGPSTVRSLEETLREQGRDWAYTTVATLLTRLEKKGFVASDRDGQKKVFRAAVTRDGMLDRRLQDLSDELADGRAVPLVNALIRRRDLSDTEVAELRRLLDAADREDGPTQRTQQERTGRKPAGKRRSGKRGGRSR